jgi:hypothetical protein
MRNWGISGTPRFFLIAFFLSRVYEKASPFPLSLR